MLKESVTKDVPGAPKRGRPPDAETTSDEDDVPIKRRRRPPPREEEVGAQYRSSVPKQQSSGEVRDAARLPPKPSDDPML